jgi:hypothetical protein
MAEPLYTDADVELVAGALYANWHASVPFVDQADDVRAEYLAGAVAALDALTAAGWLKAPGIILRFDHDITREQIEEFAAAFQRAVHTNQPTVLADNYDTRVPARVAEEIAQAIERAASQSYRTRGAAYRHAANIAREIGGRDASA